MNRTERLYKIDLLLNQRRCVPVQTFLDELEVSLATFKRDLDYLRERLNAPIVWDSALRGYRFERQEVGERYELPGLWFNASEIHALLTMQHLLESLGPGLLSPHVQPLLARLRILLEQEGVSADEVRHRIHLHRLAARTYEPEHFAPIASAVLQRRRLVINHYNRSRNQTLQREVSPQRLTHYRENWYLDAYCHLREEVRSFSLDAIRGVQLSPEVAHEVPEKVLHEVLDGGYGIFAGKQLQWAELVFSPEKARWVSSETWHPEQQGSFAEDGSYYLKVPYSDPTELAMDIQRHLPEVKVLAPASLQQHIRAQLEAALKFLE